MRLIDKAATSVSATAAAIAAVRDDAAHGLRSTEACGEGQLLHMHGAAPARDDAGPLHPERFRPVLRVSLPVVRNTQAMPLQSARPEAPRFQGGSTVAICLATWRRDLKTDNTLPLSQDTAQGLSHSACIRLCQVCVFLGQPIIPVSVFVSYVTFTCWNCRRHTPASSVALASGGPIGMS